MGYVGDFCDDVARSIGFLSRIPMPGRHFVGYDGRLNRAVRAFPLAGIVIVLPSAAAASAMNALQVGSLFAAFVVIALQALLTGALHEDGLGDTADGFGGGRDRDAALDIMKDSRVGTYGEMCAAAGLVSLHFVNITDQRPAVAPWRGSDGRFGTNPLCIALPVCPWNMVRYSGPDRT